MTGAEVRKMTGEELDLEIDRLQRRLFDLRCQTVTEKVEDTSEFGKIKRDIARMKTERTSRVAKNLSGKSGAGKSGVEAGA